MKTKATSAPKKLANKAGAKPSIPRPCPGKPAEPANSLGTAPRVAEAEFSAAATQSSQLPAPVGVEIAFAGRSNVGKSSLLNALMQRRNLARTSSTPGCTRQIVFFKIRTADDAQYTFVDLPGYGYAKRSHQERAQWGKLIEDYLIERPTLALLMILFDTRRGFSDSETQLLELIAQTAARRWPVRAIAVATKIDKATSSDRERTLRQTRESLSCPVLGVSTRSPQTQAELWRVLRKTLEHPTTEP